MKRLLASFIFALACISLSAQCPPGGGGGSVPSVGSGSTISASNLGGTNGNSLHSLNQQVFNDAFGGRYSVQTTYANTNGSAFLTENDVEGTLILNDGSELKNVPLQFDLYKQEFIATNSKGEKMYIDKRFYQEIIIPIDGRQVSLRKINPKKPEQFYEVLYDDGDMTFFKERYVSLREAENNGIVNRQAEFKNRTKYYIKHGDNEVAKVKLKKKDFFSGFAGTEVYAMKEYAKKKGLKLKNESDYVALFEGIAK